MNKYHLSIVYMYVCTTNIPHYKVWQRVIYIQCVFPDHVYGFIVVKDSHICSAAPFFYFIHADQ